MRTSVIPGVLWREGMFLSTQHFQAFQRELTSRVASGERASTPCGYGLIHLSVDVSRLEQDVFAIREVECLFGDGTLARAPGNAEVQPRAFGEAFKDASLLVWIGIPEAQPNIPQLDSGADSAHARYRAVAEATYDENLRDAQQQVDFRVLRLQLFFGEDPPAGFDCVPIARLVREGRPVAKSVLSPDYVPPMVNCGAAPNLLRKLQELAERCRSRARDLATRVPTIERLSDVQRGVDFAGLLLLQSINRTTAVLEQLSRAPALDPYLAFLDIVRCCGDLAVFAPPRSSPVFPAFDQAASDACFKLALGELDRLIDAQVEMPSEFTPFEREADAEFFQKARIPVEWFDRRSIFFLGVQLARPADVVSQLVPDGLKLLAPSESDRVLNGALPGIPLRYERQPPLAFPKRDDLHYFRIETEGAARDSWMRVQDERAALLLNPLEELSQARFEFYVEKARRHG